MNFQTTIGPALKALAGAALLGLGMDQISCRLTDVAFRMLNEVVGAVFWGVLSSLQASEAGIFAAPLHFLACPLEAVSFVQPLLNLLGRAL